MDEDLVTSARRLLRAARVATLATQDAGQPSASLVTPATAQDGSILLLLSDLANHTRHLRAEPRCALLLTGATTGANPQTTPRLTLTGVAALEPDPALKQRFVALHPYAAGYAGFGDFNVWRMRPGGGLFVGGFARARPLSAEDLATDAPEVAAAEARVITHCNDDHAEALDAIANMHGSPGEGWRMVACDADGFDLARAQAVCRIPFRTRVESPAAIRAELVHLAGAARNPEITMSGRHQPTVL